MSNGQIIAAVWPAGTADIAVIPCKGLGGRELPFIQALTEFQDYLVQGALAEFRPIDFVKAAELEA